MSDRMLPGHLRVLDLTDEKGFLCGKVLAELGADVLKIERPGGDSARHIGPFYRDIPDPRSSLYWFAFNASKRGISLNLETDDGRELFDRLVKKADFVLESYVPGYMDKLGLSYSDLRTANERIIMTSISPFGQTGPRKDYLAPDLVLMGMGGLMTITGDRDRAPLRLCLDQAYSIAGLFAAVGTMLAHYYREASGQGQHVDVSIQECIARAHNDGPIRWEFEKRLTRRTGNRTGPQGRAVQAIWPCKDGYVNWTLIGGTMAAKENYELVRWLDEEGLADALKGIKWETVHMSRTSEQEIVSWQESIGEFFSKHTKKELEDGADHRGIRLAPLRDVKEVVEDQQLAARGFWTDVEHPEISTDITYPGYLFLSNEVESSIKRRAPLIGEHNKEIYEKELGLTKQTILALGKAGVI